MKKPLHLFDVVALLTDLPDEKISTGQVGTVVEELTEDVHEVAFADAQGRTITSCAVAARNLLKLTHEMAM